MCVCMCARVYVCVRARTCVWGGGSTTSHPAGSHRLLQMVFALGRVNIDPYPAGDTQPAHPLCILRCTVLYFTYQSVCVLVVFYMQHGPRHGHDAPHPSSLCWRLALLPACTSLPPHAHICKSSLPLSERERKTVCCAPASVFFSLILSASGPLCLDIMFCVQEPRGYSAANFVVFYPCRSRG